MEVDDTNGKLLGPEQHAALRGGVFWLDPPSSQSQVCFPEQFRQGICPLKTLIVEPDLKAHLRGFGLMHVREFL